MWNQIPLMEFWSLIHLSPSRTCFFLMPNHGSRQARCSGDRSLLGRPPHAMPSSPSPRTPLASAEEPRTETPRSEWTCLPHDPGGPLREPQILLSYFRSGRRQPLRCPGVRCPTKNTSYSLCLKPGGTCSFKIFVVRLSGHVLRAVHELSCIRVYRIYICVHKECDSVHEIQHKLISH